MDWLREGTAADAMRNAAVRTGAETLRGVDVMDVAAGPETQAGRLCYRGALGRHGRLRYAPGLIPGAVPGHPRRAAAILIPL
jgi:hypothetical protein